MKTKNQNNPIEFTTKRFFMVGAQRSGTTMLQLMLNSHSQIAVSREAEFLMPFLKRKYLKKSLPGGFLSTFYNNYFSTVEEDVKFSYEPFNEYFSGLSDKEAISLRDLIDGMFSGYCISEGKKIWGNKTPLFIRKIDILSALFPDAKFIHIVRDGRDVFDSRRKLRQTDDDVIVTGLDWRYKLMRAEKSFKKIPKENQLTVRYEDVLDDPETALKSICSLLGVMYEENMQDFHKTSRNHLSVRHSKWIFNGIKKDNKFKWKNNLTPVEINAFNLLAEHYLKKYNYEVPGIRLNLSVVRLIIKSIFAGLPNKISNMVQRKKTFDKAIFKSRLSGRYFK